MLFSFSTLLSMIFINGILIGIIFLFILQQSINYRNINLFLLGTFIITLRFLLPFEFPFTISVPIRHLLPALFDFFNTELFSILNHSVSLFNIFLFLWIIGIPVFAVKSHLSYKNTLKYYSAYEPSTDFPALPILQEITSSYKLRHEIRLLATAKITTPVVFGILHPCIIVPDMDLSENEWRHILHHEVIHCHDHHLVYKLLCEILHIIYFWNPLITLLNQQINRILEISVDAKIITNLTMDERTEYAGCLLKVEKAQASAYRKEHDFMASFASFGPFSITQRINLIIGSPKKVRSITPHILLSSFILTFCLVFTLFFVFEPFRMRPADSEPDIFRLQKGNSYFIINDDGTYDLYYNSEYITTVSNILDDDIPVYTK